MPSTPVSRQLASSGGPPTDRPTAAVETFLRLHAYAKLGGRPIGSIRRSEIQAWVKALTGVLAPATVELVPRWCRPSSRPPSATG